MSGKAMSLKAKIKNYAKANNITAQVILQNYMFECFLARLSMSSYSDKFVVKGGMLIAAIVGLDTRATMDLDTTLRNLALTEEKIRAAIEEIKSIDLDDDVSFHIISIDPIRKDDIYGGYCVRINATYDTILTPLSIDISTGDIITPDLVEYEFSGIFDENLRIKLWGYNLETVLAEKIETILSRGVFTSRPRDFYDVYILATTQHIDKEIFEDALTATAIHRGTKTKIVDTQSIIAEISDNKNLKDLWRKYQRQFVYAKDITYQDTIDAIRELVL